MWWWRYSIGSSIVRMCAGFDRLMRSIIAASVVDLPLPVGPVTSTRPRGRSASSASTGGSPSSSSGRIFSGIRRSTAPTAPFWLKTLQRNRPTPRRPKARSSSQDSSNFFFCASVSTLYASALITSGVRSGYSSRLRCAVDAHLRRRSHRQMEVRPSKLQRRLQQIRQVHDARPSRLPFLALSLSTSSLSRLPRTSSRLRAPSSGRRAGACTCLRPPPRVAVRSPARWR